MPDAIVHPPSSPFKGGITSKKALSKTEGLFLFSPKGILNSQFSILNLSSPYSFTIFFVSVAVEVFTSMK